MREEIHPEFYPDAQVVCACGNSWTVGSTQPMTRTDVCSQCHPFFTGEQRILDSGGQVERFLKKLERREKKIAELERQKTEDTSPSLPIDELDLRTRAKNVLIEGGIETVGDALKKLEEGDEALMNLHGFGLKSLATLKKRLRAKGFILPGDEEPETTE